MYLKRVEQKSSEILRQLGISETPVPIREIARRLGLTILPYDLGDNVSGVLVVNKGSGTIGYDPTESSVRQRFTIAHELGHYVLHGSSKDELFVDKEFKVLFRDQRSSTGELKREQEANSFAASILMPEELLRKEIGIHAYDLTDEDAIKKLAKIFDVSPLAMTYRISNLNLF